MFPNSFKLCLLTAWVSVLAAVSAGDTSVALDSAPALDAVKTYVAEAANSGKKVQVWIASFAEKAQLSKADNKKVTVLVDNNAFDFAWEKLSKKDILNIAKPSVQDVGKRSLLLFDYCIAVGELDEAEKALTETLQLDPGLKSEVAGRGKTLQEKLQAEKAAQAPPKLGPVAVKTVPVTTPGTSTRAKSTDSAAAGSELAAAPKSEWYPHSAGEMHAMLNVLDPNRIKNPDLQYVYIHRLMQHRYICNVPYEGLHADDKLVDLAEHAALICNKLGKLSHNPEKPAGMSDDEYALCKKGAGSSNLFGGVSEPLRCVDGWMDDSDKGNIDRLGHRRWCLNPKMLKTGFGHSGKYAAMHSFDGSRRNIPDWDFVAYPARGYMPVEFFGNRRAWSVSLNDPKYGPVNKDTLKVELFHASDKFEPEGQAMKLDYMDVNSAGFGTGTAIIFRPETIEIGKGGRYIVKIAGLKKPIVYGVHFVHVKDLPDDTDSHNVLTQFFAQRVEALAKEPQPIDQLEGLMELSADSLLAGADPAVAKTVAQGIQNLGKDPVLRREHDSRERYKAAAELERKAAAQKGGKKIEAAHAYAQVAQDFKDTAAGQKAAADLERLKKEMQ